MGLLDVFDTVGGQQALGLLAAAGPRSDGAGFGQRLQEGLGAADNWKRKKAADEFQQMQIEAYKAKVLQEKQAMEAAMAKRAALPSLVTSGSAGAPALNVDSLLPPELRTGLAPQAAVAPRQASIDWQAALKAGYSPKEIHELDSLRNVGMDEVARVENVMQNGREVAQQLDKYGRGVGQGMEKYKAPIMMDRGGQTDVVSPYIQPGQSFAKTMTFADRNAAGNLAISQQRFALDRDQSGKPEKAPSGYKWNADGSALEAIPGGPASGSKLTESESKSTLYLSQMRDATKALSKIGDEVSPVMIAATGSPYTNWMAGDTSQKAGQAQRQWAEAYLREKTGAAATAGEVENNIKTFFPVTGDSTAVIAQKKAARASAEKAMEIPAGRGAAKIASPSADTSNIPQAAINKLKMSPSLRAAFDEKYGAGSAASVLGN